MNRKSHTVSYAMVVKNIKLLQSVWHTYGWSFRFQTTRSSQAMLNSSIPTLSSLATEVNKKLQSYIDHFTMSETLFKQTTGRDLYNQLASVYKAQITKMFNELDEYPSYFATFEMPLKVYVVNKKVFLH